MNCLLIRELPLPLIVRMVSFSHDDAYGDADADNSSGDGGDDLMVMLGFW